LPESGGINKPRREVDMKGNEVSSKPAATFFEAVERAEVPRVR
jgi:hypothetical protein